MTRHNSITPLLFTLFIFLFSCQPDKTVLTPESVGLSSDTLDLAQAKMQQYIDSGKFAGISTLIMKNGEIIQRANFGYADFQTMKPINDSTIFRIFSMTKPIVSVALMKLYDEGKFTLQDPLYKFIPQFKEMYVYLLSYYCNFFLRSLPGLKWGTYLPRILTDSPVLGFLPTRGGG